MRASTLLAATLLVALVLLACTPASDDAPAEIRSSAPAGGDASAHQAKGRVVATATYREATTLAGNDQFVLKPLRSSRRLEVIDRFTGTVVFQIPSSLTTRSAVALDGDWLAWTSAAQGGPTRLDAVNLRTGLRRSATDSAGDLRALGQPEDFDLHDGRLAYVTQDGVPTNCVVVVDLSTGIDESRLCTMGRERGTGKPRLTDYGLVANQWSPRPKPDGCVRLVVAPISASKRSVNSDRRCGAWSGVLGDGVTAWSEPSPTTPERSRLYVETDGERTSLGKAETSSERVCGEAIYWLTTVSEIGEVRRWLPGHKVETVYRMPEEGALALWDLACTDTRLYVKEGADGPDLVRLLEVEVPASR